MRRGEGGGGGGRRVFIAETPLTLVSVHAGRSALALVSATWGIAQVAAAATLVLPYVLYAGTTHHTGTSSVAHNPQNMKLM